MTSGSNKVNITAGILQAIGHESLTISNTAVRLTLATLTDSDGNFAKRATITIEDAQLRWTYDGTTPTSSVGHLNNPFDSIIIMGTLNIQNFRAIRSGSTDSNIRVTYEL